MIVVIVNISSIGVGGPTPPPPMYNSNGPITQAVSTVAAVKRIPFLGCESRAIAGGWFVFHKSARMICAGVAAMKENPTQVVSTCGLNAAQIAQVRVSTMSVAKPPLRSMIALEGGSVETEAAAIDILLRKGSWTPRLPRRRI